MAAPNGRAPELAEIERVIRNCGAHLLGSFSKNGFIPTYAAFYLIGDADMGGREMLMALTGSIRAATRTQRCCSSGADLHRAFAGAGADQPALARDRRADVGADCRSAIARPYYDAFFTEALLSFVETGLPSADQTAASQRAISEMVDFCLEDFRRAGALA